MITLGIEIGEKKNFEKANVSLVVLIPSQYPFISLANPIKSDKTCTFFQEPVQF